MWCAGALTGLDVGGVDSAVGPHDAGRRMALDTWAEPGTTTTIPLRMCTTWIWAQARAAMAALASASARARRSTPGGGGMVDVVGDGGGLGSSAEMAPARGSPTGRSALAQL